MGICGSCGMFINGFPRLACQTQIMDLKSDEVQVKPMPNYDILKDLIPDLKPMIDKHKYIHPYLIRKEEKDIDDLRGEFFQTEEELINYIQFSFCIKCGLCMAACPTLATDEDYIGPQPLGQLFRYNSDTRDEGNQVRFDLIDVSDGPWKCHFAGACSDVCPKGVDPAFAIQLLKKDMLLHKLKIKRKKKGAQILDPVKDSKRLPDIPDAPEPTV
jgi:succinate dehydrogenase / fumarate reductase iron-sulfur subunit